MGLPCFVLDERELHLKACGIAAHESELLEVCHWDLHMLT